MAIVAAPFALKNLGLDAEPLRQAVASLVPNGGGIVQPGDLNVTQTSVLSLGVLVGVGRAWMPGTNTANLTGQNYSTQAQYFATNDAPFTVNLATADPTNARIDLIYIGAVDTFYGGATDIIKIDKVTGVPSGSPVVPTLPANSIPLAQVTVAANATTVANAVITNKAVPAFMRHMEWSGVTASQTSGAGQNFGNLAPDAANTYNGGFASFAANGWVTFSQGGVYVIEAKSSPTAAYTALQLWAFDGGGAQHCSATGTGYGGQAFTSTFTFACAAGATLQFGSTYNVTATAAARVKITKIG